MIYTSSNVGEKDNDRRSFLVSLLFRASFLYTYLKTTLSHYESMFPDAWLNSHHRNALFLYL